MNINITPEKNKTILETFQSLRLLKSLGIANKKSTITGIAGELLPAGYYSDAGSFVMALRGHYFNNGALVVESTNSMSDDDAKECLQEWEKQFRISRGIEIREDVLNVNGAYTLEALRDIFDVSNTR